MNIIYLTGMPASGKTYWGTRVGEAFGLPFIDLDEFIIQREREPITQLFSKGEGWFRGKEHASLINLIGLISRPTIVATGGGTPCYFNNLKQMQRSGVVIYLKAHIDTLASRIKNDNTMRPLLRNKTDIAGALQQLLQQRERYYNQAAYILQSEDISLNTFEEIITKCINRHSPQGLSLQW